MYIVIGLMFLLGSELGAAEPGPPDLIRGGKKDDTHDSTRGWKDERGKIIVSIEHDLNGRQRPQAGAEHGGLHAEPGPTQVSGPIEAR
jgi:hypothetical protein